MAATVVGIIAGGIIIAPQVPLQPFLRHPRASHSPTVAQIKAYAKAKYAQDDIQFEALDLLLTMESHWNYKARGGRTSQGRAYGIAQALPADKMKVSGADYLTNPYTQIDWTLLYLKSRYKNNAMYALRHEMRYGWW